MQVQTDPSQHLWEMSLGRGARHTQQTLCAHTDPSAGKGSSGVSIVPWPPRRRCEMSIFRQGWVSSGSAELFPCRGALADAPGGRCHESWERSSSAGSERGCEAETGINTPPQAAFFLPSCSQFHVVEIAQPFSCLCSLPGCVTSTTKPFIHRFCPVSSLMQEPWITLGSKKKADG